MPAVGVVQGSGGVAIPAEKKRSITFVRGVAVQVAIDRSEEPRNILHLCAVFAAKAPVQICHQQSRRDALTCNIRQREPDGSRSHIEKIVVISPDHSGLSADSGVLESL